MIAFLIVWMMIFVVLFNFCLYKVIVDKDKLTESQKKYFKFLSVVTFLIIIFFLILILGS